MNPHQLTREICKPSPASGDIMRSSVKISNGLLYPGECSYKLGFSVQLISRSHKEADSTSWL